jgi:ArsR family transcriptional regulator
MRDLAAVFRALADETRLEMLALLLRHGELCVCDLQATLGIGQSKASRHLRYLTNAGLLTDRRAGLWVHYRIAPDLDPERRAVMAAAGRLLKARDLGALEARFAQWLRRKSGGPACPPVPAPRARRQREARG